MVVKDKEEVAYFLTDQEGNLIDYYISDELVDILRADDMPDLTKEEICSALFAAKDRAAIMDSDGEVIRPENATIN